MLLRRLATGLAVSLAALSIPQSPAPRVMVLPVLCPATSDAATGARWALMARAVLTRDLLERGFDVVSAIQVQALADGKRINLQAAESWTPDTFKTLGDPHRARYALTVLVKSMSDKDPHTVEATAVATLYDLHLRRYVFEGREAAAAAPWSGEDAKPAAQLTAASEAARAALKDYLAKFPKVKKPKR